MSTYIPNENGVSQHADDGVKCEERGRWVELVYAHAAGLTSAMHSLKVMAALASSLNLKLKPRVGVICVTRRVQVQDQDETGHSTFPIDLR